ncbi:hypothetical protein HYDPIDRAFT_34559 [Hydnomerulius pinastri MD-312]|uniref:Fungal-type protein kinase domain-containing protein n=1 Tax=Hydnomerulius pinastri MD-312 TaxID=994086 RepID=A0A0C9VXK3_9AGAM|nr:hypothetical protein HYDPIDRAFT_34559 [Hydnomerulius pinastri MD-312]
MNLLQQLKAEFDKSSSGSPPPICKSTSLTHVFINKQYADDIESLFYVFIWILILYEGPLGHERQDVSHEKTLLGLWSEEAASNLAIARSTKVSPYNDLLPLAHQWCKLLGPSVLCCTPLLFSDVMALLDDLLASMPDEKPPEMTNTFQQIVAQHKALNSMFPIELTAGCFDADASPIMPCKRLPDKVGSMDNPPLPNKRFKGV